jgi:integrase
MARQTPYLQRRGFSLFFRIGVPPDLRLTVGSRELTKSPKMSDRIRATPIALSLAAKAKQLFNEIRERMGKKTKVDSLESGYTLTCEFDDFGQVKSVAIQAEPHETESAVAAGTAMILARAQAGAKPTALATTDTTPRGPPQWTPQATPTFKAVVDDYLAKYAKKNKSAMLKKHLQALPMLLEVVGDKPITEIKQGDINRFFELLGRLPPQWAAECRRSKLTIFELAEMEHEETIGPKTFDATYVSCVRPFLKAARKDWQDLGFPLGPSTDGVQYVGDREEGEHKQRALKPAELVRLFGGAEMKIFARDTKKAHFYWLPHLGLFTGARVNELCQLNPQVDIFMDADTKTWCLNISKDTAADERIKKSVKTGEARKVPIHKTLLELGFVEYVERIKATGAKLLFPEWKPINRRASGEAEKWFRQLLLDTELRDETPGLCLLGMHIFRHTLLTYGVKQEPALGLFGITGHAQGDIPIPVTGAARGYLTASLISPLDAKSVLLDQLDYGIDFIKPIALGAPSSV